MSPLHNIQRHFQMMKPHKKSIHYNFVQLWRQSNTIYRYKRIANNKKKQRHQRQPVKWAGLSTSAMIDHDTNEITPWPMHIIYPVMKNALQLRQQSTPLAMKFIEALNSENQPSMTQSYDFTKLQLPQDVAAKPT